MGKHTDIRWLPWGDEAFGKARKEKKPILLDLSAVWCHWCHVMDETSYSDDEIIDLINKEFVAIRVDIDQRPDIRERYNFGGYPTTAFLDDEGGVIAGGTYIPPDQLKRTLMQVKGYYETSGGKARERKVPPETVIQPSEGGLSMDIMEEVLGYLLQQYDDLYGGFGSAPKFPQPEALDLALYHYKVSGNNYILKVVEKSLGAMAEGGMYDPVEGGFFRYSVTRDWSEPHYEKMLDVNVGLLRNYLNAYALLGERRYREVAEDVLRYLEKVLRDPRGGFYGSQDADEEYYKLAKEGREKMEVPFVDQTIYADLNGQAVSTYLRAAAVLGDEAYLKAAVSTLDSLEKRLFSDDGHLFHYWDGEPRVDGLLSDHVHMAKAYLDAYEHVGDDGYLKKATSLAEHILNGFRDEDGLLVDRQSAEGDVGLLKVAQKPLVDNSHAASLLLRLAEVTGESKFKEAAQGILEGFTGQYSRYSIFASFYAVAVSTYLKGPLKLVVVGDGDEHTDAVRMELLAAFQPRRVLQLLRPGSRAFREARYPEEPVPAVYACVGTQCSNPITGPHAMAEAEAFLARVDSSEGVTPDRS